MKILIEPFHEILRALGATIIKRTEVFDPLPGVEPETFEAFATVALGNGRGMTVKLSVDVFEVAIENGTISNSQSQNAPGQSSA